MTDLQDRRDLETTVYQPAEDSHLLATTAIDAIDGDLRVLDVGTGSGFVGAMIAERTGATVVGVDINPHACRRARNRGIEVVRGDLVAPFADNQFDVVVCNPPYLPEPAMGAFDDWMETALSGGESGQALIKRLLATVGRVLTPTGIVLLLVSTITGVDDIATYAGEQGFSSIVVAEDAYPFETLTVLKLIQH